MDKGQKATSAAINSLAGAFNNYAEKVAAVPSEAATSSTVSTVDPNVILGIVDRLRKGGKDQQADELLDKMYQIEKKKMDKALND